MDLQIKDVAELLNVTENAIKDWVTAGQIPYYRIDSDYRFSRIEIEDWVIRSQKNDFHLRNVEDEAKGRGNRQFSLYRAIHKGGVLHSIPGKSKEEVIRNAMAIIAKDLALDKDILTDLLLDRENLQPTAIGSGIGLPHTREAFIKNSFDSVYVVFPERAISDYGALDGKPVHSLFFLFAASDKNHLHLLAKIAHFCAQQHLKQLIEKKPNKISLLEEIKQWESHINA